MVGSGFQLEDIEFGDEILGRVDLGKQTGTFYNITEQGLSLVTGKLVDEDEVFWFVKTENDNLYQVHKKFEIGFKLKKPRYS